MTEKEAIEWLECIVYEQAPKTQKAMLLGIRALVEIQQYRALGTVEELKEAKEKQIAKKPIWVERSFTKFQICPSCSNAEHYKMVWKQEKYCVDCGQKLDWGNEDDRD
jgi:hypothetical protein